jgi:hypothetical protein
MRKSVAIPCESVVIPEDGRGVVEAGLQEQSSMQRCATRPAILSAAN